MEKELFLIKSIQMNQSLVVIEEFKSGELYVLAGRPAAGKTNAITKLIWDICKIKNAATLLFSLEMSGEQIHERTVSICNCTSEQLKELPLFVQDATYTLEEMTKTIKKYVEENSVRYVLIDYLQLIKREDMDIQSIYNALKLLAQELNTTIIAASQVKRNGLL